MVTSVDIVDNN